MAQGASGRVDPCSDRQGAVLPARALPLRIGSFQRSVVLGVVLLTASAWLMLAGLARHRGIWIDAAQDPELWRSQLTSADADCRLTAAAVLVDKDAPAAIPILIDLLEDPQRWRGALAVLRRHTGATFQRERARTHEQIQASVLAWRRWWLRAMDRRETCPPARIADPG